MSSYTMATTVERDFPETVELVRAALVAQGFGIITEIDMSATLKAKLDVDMLRRSSSGHVVQHWPTRHCLPIRPSRHCCPATWSFAACDQRPPPSRRSIRPSWPRSPTATRSARWQPMPVSG